jgi:hypothetical protein
MKMLSVSPIVATEEIILSRKETCSSYSLYKLCRSTSPFTRVSMLTEKYIFDLQTKPVLLQHAS